MRLFRLMLWSLLSCATAPPSVEGVPLSNADAQNLMGEVKENGARNSVLRLRRDRHEWNHVMEHIAMGQREWIDLAVSLKPGSDAAEGRELRNAMFRALRRNPSYVLERAQPEYPLAVLCLGRADPLPSHREAAAELKAVQRALQKVRSESLRAKREFCLATLEEGRASLQRSLH